MKKILYSAAIAAASCILSAPASAEVKSLGDNGFWVFQVAEVDAAPDVIWKRMISPKDYWDAEHSWSGSIAGFSIDPRAGGCFCELIQSKGSDGKLKTTGSVEHMRVIYAEPSKVLRMQGAMGPLQSEAMLGTMTMAIEPLKSGTGSKISWSYVAGGYMRYKTAEIAPAVDKVFGEQFARLIQPYGKPGEAPAMDAGKASEWTLDVDKIVDAAPDAKTSTEDAASGDASVTNKDTAVVKPKSKTAPKPVLKPKPKTTSASDAEKGGR